MGQHRRSPISLSKQQAACLALGATVVTGVIWAAPAPAAAPHKAPSTSAKAAVAPKKAAIAPKSLLTKGLVGTAEL
ncbi:hypothetical protein, partial [Thermoactinospora rubra]|uniref:hypothetical protein n=1 Tax=Thermoactinospora rubra TaxID=1088767 RepID=UPI00197CCB44